MRIIYANREKETMRLQDDLEAFIASERTAFDTAEPSAAVWQRIAVGLETQAKPAPARLRVLRRWGRVAAAIALLAVGGTAGFFLKSVQERRQTEAEIVATLPDFKATTRFYDAQIETYKAKLVAYNPDPTVLADLAQIDAVQEELKKALAEAPRTTRETIVRQMIENYKIKLAILERVLAYLEANKSPAAESRDLNHEKI